MAAVLVVHASRHGSTTEVAQRIGQVLRDSGHIVDVLPARDVRHLVERPDLVVVGGALYSGRWHPDARRFLRRHREPLGHTRVAVFGMGPRTDDPEAWQRSDTQLNNALGTWDGPAPVAVTVFGGVDPRPRRGQPRRDARNWQAIDAWAAQLAANLSG